MKSFLLHVGFSKLVGDIEAKGQKDTKHAWR